MYLWPKFSWNDGIDTCFNGECVLLSRNFDFLGGYLVVTARYLGVTSGYWLLLVVTTSCRSLLLIPIFSMNDFILKIHEKKHTETYIKYIKIHVGRFAMRLFF